MLKATGRWRQESGGAKYRAGLTFHAVRAGDRDASSVLAVSVGGDVFTAETAEGAEIKQVAQDGLLAPRQ